MAEAMQARTQALIVARDQRTAHAVMSIGHRWERVSESTWRDPEERDVSYAFDHDVSLHEPSHKTYVPHGDLP